MASRGISTSLLLASATCAALGAPAALAQEVGKTDPLDEIVVTASRRAQSLQDTAMSVDAVTAQHLVDTGITNTAELQTTVPNLQYSTSGDGESFVYLRGVGNAVYGSFSDNSVATYIDGVYVPRSTVADQELFDIERVEVLRGPQATLYGRNATGGAVLINTAAPTDTFSGAADVAYGNYADERIRAVVSGPLGDGIDGRISVVRHKNEGYDTNLADGSHYGGEDFWGTRLSLSALFGENINVLLIVNYSKEDGSLGATKVIDPNAIDFLPIKFGGFGEPFSPNPFASYHNIDVRHEQEAYGATLKVNWDLGFADLISTTAQQDYRDGPDFIDLDDSLSSRLEYMGSTEDIDFTYQDFLLRSHSGASKLDWLAGAIYVHEDDGSFGRTGLQFSPFMAPFVDESVSSTTVKGYALYGQLDYHFTDKVTLVSGLRYSDESRAGSTEDFTFAPGFPTSNSKSWNDFSPKFALEYRPVAHVLVYASATHGFKSGAFDPQNPANAVKPETIWSYEVGARTEVLDGLTLNATVFHYKMTNRQLFGGVTDPITHNVVIFLQNAGGATGDGAELEAEWRPVQNFRVGGNLALLDARYDHGTVLADTSNAVSYPVATVPISDVGGNQMEQSPKVSVSVHADWRIPLGNIGSLDIYADDFYQTTRYFTAFEDPTLSSKPYDLVNARATYTPPNQRWYVAGYVRNAGNALVEGYMSRVPPGGTSVSYNPPRTYGIETGTKF